MGDMLTHDNVMFKTVLIYN